MAKKYKITTVHKYQESFRHRKFRKEENTIKRKKSQNWCPVPVGRIGWWKMQIEAKRTFPPRAQNATNCLRRILSGKTKLVVEIALSFLFHLLATFPMNMRSTLSWKAEKVEQHPPDTLGSGLLTTFQCFL